MARNEAIRSDYFRIEDAIKFYEEIITGALTIAISAVGRQ